MDMHTCLLPLACLLISFAAQAQPVLDSSYAPRVGRVFNYNQDNGGVAVLRDGPNETYTCSFSQPSYIQHDSVVPGTDPSPIDPLFLQANRRVIINRSITAYYIINASRWATLGSYTTGAVVITFPTPNPVVPIGLTYQQQSIHTYDAIINSAGNFTYEHDIDTTTYTGYGTAIVNGATFNDCILITRKRAVYNRTDTTQPYQFRVLYTIKSVYAPGFGSPVATYTLQPIGGGSFGRTAYFISYRTPSAIHSSLAYEPLSLWPNPARAEAYLKIPGQEGYTGIATLFTPTGLPAATLHVQNSRLDISSLPPGLYVAEIIAADRRYRTRVVKE